MHEIFHALGHGCLHAFIDSLKLLPFLFMAYLLLEWIEHKGGARMERIVRRAGAAGPLLGATVGAVPQCGFAAVASQLYAARIVSLGTLIAVFLSASDEMLPVLVAEGASPLLILKLLGFKVLVGILFGFLIDLFVRLLRRGKTMEGGITDICESEGCHCEDGILRSALRHTAQVYLFVFLATAVLSVAIEWIGEESLARAFGILPSPVVGALIGLIPNCASSVVLTELYLSGVISVGGMLSGLLSGAGVGILVLFRSNKKHVVENLAILLCLYLIGAGVGLLADLTPLHAFFV